MTSKVRIDKPEDLDLLRGMGAICTFLRMSEETVLKWSRQYDNFPLKKNGTYLSSKRKLNEWYRWYLDQP